VILFTTKYNSNVRPNSAVERHTCSRGEDSSSRGEDSSSRGEGQ